MARMNTSSKPATDTVFAGSVPKIYETFMVPLIFEPYANDIANRVAARSPKRVLELAAGTGVVTRKLAAMLPPGTSIVATDLNPKMLEQAQSVVTDSRIEWREADAMQLPFEDASFDAVVCQFGVMFFPDKPKAFAEVRRLLRPGGTYFFNSWDRIEENEFADVVTNALATIFPDDPPRFMARTPHGYHDRSKIEADVRGGGFTDVRIDTLPSRSRAPTARDPAVAYCQGTPLRNEIETRGPGRLGEATDICAKAIASRFGAGPVDGKISAHVATLNRT